MINEIKDYWWIISTFFMPIATYLIGFYRKKEERLKSIEEKEFLRTEALKTLLQAELTKTFYKYEEKKEVPSHVYKNWLNLLAAYEGLEGNDYIHELDNRFRKFKIIKQ